MHTYVPSFQFGIICFYIPTLLLIIYLSLILVLFLYLYLNIEVFQVIPFCFFTPLTYLPCKFPYNPMTLSTTLSDDSKPWSPTRSLSWAFSSTYLLIWMLYFIVSELNPNSPSAVYLSPLHKAPPLHTPTSKTSPISVVTIILICFTCPCYGGGHHSWSPISSSLVFPYTRERSHLPIH